jgi:CRISPR/Cas system CMR-associated protein Cmr5 small subunit
MVRQLAAAKDNLTVANDHISDLQHANKSLSNKTAALKDAAEKSANLLAVRTKRFVEFRVWKEDEVKRVKARVESTFALPGCSFILLKL